jgi:oligogalacturonide lyase
MWFFSETRAKTKHKQTNTAMKKCKLVCSLPGMLLIPFLLFPDAHSQVIEGVDYSGRSGVYETFDMAKEDVFGKRFPSEHMRYIDEVTGVEVIALTTSRRSSSKMYQTHPQWTPDGKYIVFTSRFTDSPNRKAQAYAVSMENYEIVQISSGNGGSTYHLGWKKNSGYMFKGNELIELNLGQLLSDSEQGKVGEASDYETSLGTVPEAIKPSGMGLDANENRVFFSTRLGDDLSAIYSLDFTSGQTTKHLEVPFRIGHLQSNPFVSGEVMYCWETGGDSPQRMWYMTLKENGHVENRPLYEETDEEWVTHEIFAGPDHVLFHIMGHIDRLRTNPTGIFSINIRTNESKLLGQVEGGGYWHCGASADLKWVVGDTFDGKLYRLNLEEEEADVLLTQGHRLNSISPFTSEAHLHPSISPDGKWVLINSSLLTDSDIMLVPLHSN